MLLSRVRRIVSGQERTGKASAAEHPEAGKLLPFEVFRKGQFRDLKHLDHQIATLHRGAGEVRNIKRRCVTADRQTGCSRGRTHLNRNSLSRSESAAAAGNREIRFGI